MSHLSLQKLRILLLLFAFPILANAQNLEDLDHNVLIKKLQNSENLQFKEILKKYDDFLKMHPNDIKIHIEKIEFVEYAQYDEMEDYNPNQDYLDSLKEEIFRKFSSVPEIQIFKISKVWGEEKEEYLQELVKEIESNKSKLSNFQISKVYQELASEAFNNDDIINAKDFIAKAIPFDFSVSYSTLYAKILIGLNEKDLALKALRDKRDTVSNVYYLSQKANLFLSLKSYNEAIELYKAVDKIDTNYNDRLTLAKAFEGAGLFSEARLFLLKDTSRVWGKEKPYLQLFLHDLKFGTSPDALSSYNSYRNLGYEFDNMALYRIKLFFKNPLLFWSLRDIWGLLTLAAILIFLAIIPSVFILPIYVIWERKYSFPDPLDEKFIWGLKSVWYVFILMGFATFVSAGADVELLNSTFHFSDTPMEFSDDTLALTTMLFIFIMFVFSLGFLIKTTDSVFIPNYVTIPNAIKMGFGYFIIFKLASGLYILIGKNIFNIDTNELALNKYLLLSVKDEIKAIGSVYGFGTAFLLTSVLVPIYEELIFRGILLGAFLKRMSFNYSNLLQASIFAILHQDLFLFPAFVIFGILTGKLTRRSQSILPNIIFHMLNNIAATTLLLRE